MVGDKIADIRAGQDAGAFTAAVTYGYGDLDGLTSASPDFIWRGWPNYPAFWPADPGGAVRGLKPQARKTLDSRWIWAGKIPRAPEAGPAILFDRNGIAAYSFLKKWRCSSAG